MIDSNLYNGRIKLILPNGAKGNDSSRKLEGDYKDDRRLVIFTYWKDLILKEKSCSL